MKRSKKYKERKELAEAGKTYSIQEAVELIKSYPPLNFDETVEVSGKLSADPKNTEQMVRGAVILPHGTGKQRKVLVFCEPSQEPEAKKAGADYIGNDQIIEDISKNGWCDFDCCISTPALMRKVSKLGRFLGPRGLMPSPKTGTVTDNVVAAVEEAKKGKVNFRMDKLGCIHLGLGKASFKKEELLDNIEAFLTALKATCPSNLKGNFIKTFYLSSTMGPSVRVHPVE